MSALSKKLSLDPEFLGHHADRPFEMGQLLIAVGGGEEGHFRASALDCLAR